MSLERRIAKLNRLLESELGNSPRYGWKNTDSRELSYPMLVYREDASQPDGMAQVHEYHCTCGINVNVHTPWCRLTVAVPKVEMRPLIDSENCRNSWVLCTLLYPDEQEWKQAYGTTIQYPRQGQWMAVSSGTTTLVIPSRAVPDERSTDQVIRMIKESRSITPGQWLMMWAERRNREEKQHKDNMRDRFREMLGVSLAPGKRSGATSMPSVITHHN